MPAPRSKTTKPEQRHIQSIEIGFRLIGVLEAAQAKLPLKSVAEGAGMPASKAHLYMVSFMRLGLVAQDPTTLHYGLGPYAIQLGLAGMRQLDVLDIARGPMEELRQACGLSTYLSVWGNMGPTIVAKFDGNPDVPLTIQVGHVLPLLVSATGRMFLAHLPTAAVAPVLKAAAQGGADPGQVIAEAREEARAFGITRSDNRIFDGFAALSAPVFDSSGAIAATITLLGLRSRVDLGADGAMACRLRAACALVSATLGFKAPVAAPELPRTDVPKRRPRRAAPAPASAR